MLGTLFQFMNVSKKWYSTIQSSTVPSKCIAGLIKLTHDVVHVLALLRLNQNIEESLLWY